jgi:hypothetical protein
MIKIEKIQLFLFTHDKGFFEILKEKMSWKNYEVYVDNTEEIDGLRENI